MIIIIKEGLISITMNDYKDFLNARIDILKEEGEKFLKREITLHQFKGQSGGFGIYAERGGESFVIRIKIPCGEVTTKYIDFINYITKKYNIDELHLTTRQAFQIHRQSLDTIINIFKECIDNDIFLYGGGGNFPRNVALSPMSCVDKDSVFDVSPYAHLTQEYFLRHMQEYRLPRKIKVAFSSNDKLAPNVTATDLGFLAIKDGDENMFKVFIAGGLGQNPIKGISLKHYVAPKDVLYYVSALVSLFKDYGNYENRNKARIRYILDELGEDKFLDTYDSYVEKAKKTSNLDILCIKEKDEVPQSNGSLKQSNNLFLQKQKGRYTVLIHPALGNISSKNFLAITQFLKETKSKDMISLMVSPEESMYVTNLEEDEALSLLDLVKPFNENTKLGQSICCVGVPVCQIGLADTTSALSSVLKHFRKNGLDKDLLPSIRMSGCPNSCGKHTIAPIGFMGKKKMVDGEIVDIFSVFINGNFSLEHNNVSSPLVNILGTDIPSFLEDIYHELEDMPFDKFKNSKKLDDILDKYKLA